MYNLIMLGFLRGKVHAYKKDYVLLDVNNVGYRINFYHPELLEIDKEIIIYTYQNISENDNSLFGFTSLDEYDFFIKLISVKGLGPKMASNMLASRPYEEIVEAIEKGDISFIKSLPGIGNKTASQIVLDLKGKLVEEVNNIDELKDVEEALKALGYKANEIKPVLKELSKEKLNEDEYLRKALSKLIK